MGLTRLAIHRPLTVLMGILLVDYANTLRERDMGRTEALQGQSESGSVRS